MRTLDVIAAILVVIGALNWGMVGLFHLDMVNFVFGATLIARIVYVLVAAAGVFQIVEFKAIQRRWTHAATA